MRFSPSSPFPLQVLGHFSGKNSYRAVLITLFILIGIRLSGQSYTINQSGTYNIETVNPSMVSLSENSTFPVPIGFNFSYFGISYDTCYVAQNGFVSFSAGSGGGCCVGQALPDPVNPNNLIAAAWTDQDTAIMQYEIIGTSPNRRLIITLSLEDHCGSEYYGQIKLFETTNVIEIHTRNWAETNAPCNPTTQGLENAAGNVAIVVPGRNSNITWSVDNGNNDFVSFTPREVYIVEHSTNYLEDDVDPIEITIIEDGFAEVPIGFSFDFFGSTYSDCFIGNNGFITFGSATDGGCCEGENLPDPSDPNNLIAAAWMHAWQSECCIDTNEYNYYYYETIGSFPNRRFVVTYYIEDLFCAAYYVGQIKLFEGTNVIEIHTDFYAEGVSPCTPVTQGIENATGDQAYFLEGRNANIDWEVPCCGDVVRFSPVSSFAEFDAGVSAIVDDPFCEGTQMMSINLRNFGSQGIDSVEVHWSWNGVTQDSVKSYVSMPSGATEYLVDLDTKELMFGETYTLKAWTSSPNGMSDGNAVNDTMIATISVGLDGVFTIGGSGPDYATITAAIAALQSTGICDSVIFNIRPGIYVGQYSIPAIDGATGDNKIIFQAENGDSTSVTLQFTSTNSSSNYVLRLNGAQNIVLQKMTLKGLGTSLSRVIELRNSASGNVIRQCAIDGRNASVTSTNNACIYSDAGNRNNTIAQNTIRYGSYGFYHYFNSAHTDHLLISDNRFIDFYSRGIYVYQPKGIQIHRNIVESTKSNARGIEVERDEDTLAIANNKIYLTLGSYGLRISNLYLTGARKARVFNNMINVEGSNCTAGLEINNCYNTNVFHNTVNVSLATAGRFALLHNSGERDTIYNNIFSNKGNGPVISSSFSSLSDVDHNNLYVTGNAFGKFGAALLDDIEQWRFGTGYDENSVSIDPYYASGTDLHVSNSLLNNAGSPDHTIGYDYDFQLRNTSAPDIGADEFSPGADDAAITDILSPVFSCDSTRELMLVLTNLGSDTIETVTIKWTINGVAQTDVIYSDIVMPEGDTAHINLTSYTFSGQPVTFRFWTSLPNGNPDSQPANDTLNYRFRLPLSGIYTIGGTNPDFATFSAAVNDLNQFHTCGPVTMRFRNGTYTEQVILDSIPTTSPINTIIFESENQDSSLVTLQWTVSNTQKDYNILLNGTDYITFRHLGFKSLTNGNATIIDGRNGTTNLVFTNNRMEGTLNDIYYTGNYMFRTLGDGQEYFTFNHNHFVGGTHAIYLSNNGYTNPKEFYITNNIFTNQKGRAILINTSDGLYIRNNQIVTNTTQSFTAIQTQSTGGYTEISGNNIICENNGGCLLMEDANISRPGNAHIFNNMARAAGSSIAFRILDSKHVNISFNNCHGTGNGDVIQIAGGDSIQVLNNVFAANSGNSYTTYFPPATITIDYNNLYSASGFIGFWNNMYTTMGAWQTGTGFDANSIYADPEFVSSTDLHINADILNGAAMPIAGITVDFDGEPRHATTPDIGADEIGVNGIDAGIWNAYPQMPFARGLQEVKAVIRNFGSETLETATISWELNGDPQPDFLYVGSLATLEDDTVVLGQYNFELNEEYNLSFWTSNPNQATDADMTNDTLVNAEMYAAVSGEVVVGFGGEVPAIASAISAMTLGGVIGLVEFHILPGIYHEPISIPAASYQSCNAPILFTSSTGNAADVIIDNNNLLVPAVRLKNVTGIHFSDITFKVTTSAYHHVVVIDTGATCSSFARCVFDGKTTTSTSNTFSTVYSVPQQGINNDFTDCTFNYGSFGLYMNGPSSSSNTGCDIVGNSFFSNHHMGLYAANSDKIRIRHNYALALEEHSTGYYGIMADHCNNLELSHNRVHNLFGGIGALIYTECDGNSGEKTRVYNNYVYSNASFSLRNSYSSDVEFFNNTIRSNGQGAAAFYWSSNLSIRNNIFECISNGPAIELLNNGSNYVSENNVFHTVNADVGELENVRIETLAEWQALGFDTSSVSLDPFFVGNTYQVRNALLDSKADPVDYITDDLDGDARALHPDMGADEFTPSVLDAGIAAINNPVMPFSAGVNPVYVRFYNNGSDTLHTLDLQWTVNGVAQPPMTWNGILAQAEVYDSLEIGTFHFQSYNVYDIRVWTSLPNGMPDAQPFNDTIVSNGLIPGMEGIYTIGGEDPDFETIALATAALTEGGASGDITFNIRDGVYSGPLTLTGPLPGLECGREVIFQSESQDSSSVELNNLGFSAPPVSLHSIGGITLRHLTIKTLTNTHSNVIRFKGGSHCLTIDQCQLEGRAIVNDTAAIIYSPSDLDSNTLITDNFFKIGSGIHLRGVTGLKSNPVIQRNRIIAPKTKGIFTYREYGVLIEGNKITSPDYNQSFGIYVDECGGHNKVISNDVHAVIGRYGIRIDGCPATTEVINNMLKVQSTSNAYGLYVTGNDTLRVYHNNISIHSTTGTLNNNTAFYSTANEKLWLANNVIASFSTVGQAFRVSTLPVDMDHNDYFTLHSGGRIGDVAGTIVSNLAQIQAATGKDQNSIVANPNYLDNDNDLHTHLTLLDGAGDTLGITADIDGELRGSPPDIGADEFDPLPSDDAGIFMFMGPSAPFSGGVNDVVVALKNYGGNLLTSAVVRWTVNGVEQAPLNWTGNLMSAKCDTIIVGSYDFEEITSYTITIWTQLPNGNPDNQTNNDLITTHPLYAALSGTYTIGGFAPDFNLMTTMQTCLNEGGIVGNVIFNFRPGIYDHPCIINDFPRSSYNHSVTFQSEELDSSSVTWKQNINNTVLIDLNDAHKITLRHLTLLNTKGHVVNIRSGSSVITLEHNLLQGNDALSGSNSLIYSPSTNEDSITILSNTFVEGYYSIYLYGATFEKAHVISGNIFTGSIHTCIYMRAADGVMISGNSFLTTSTNSSDVYVYNTTGKFTFTENLVISDDGAHAVDLNTILNVTSNASVFANNYIYKPGTGSADVVVAENMSKINIDFNTIINDQTSAAPAALFTNNLSTYNVRNNILYATKGLAYKHITGTPAVHDYNAMYSLGPIHVHNNYVDYNTLIAYVSATNTNLNSKAVDPLLQTVDQPLIAQHQLNGTGLSVADITTDINGTTRTSPPDIGAVEFTPLTHDLKVAQIESPVDGCGLSADEPVTVILVNQGSQNESNIDISMTYQGNTNSENTGATVIPAGDSLAFTFTSGIDASAFNEETINIEIDFPADLNHSNDTLEYTFTNFPPFENPVSNMIPVSGTSGFENQVSLSWSPAIGAVKYDLYLWLSSESKPSTPTHNDILTINKLATNLQYGQQYYWQVHAINICDEELPSDTSLFATRFLPDLVTDSITIPATGFSEQTIAVEWVIRNQGQGATVPGTWSDNIYLSNDPTYNSFDPLLASVSSLNSLNPDVSYAHSASVTLPQGSNGLYYIIVKTDHYGQVKETLDNNNTSYSVTQINITLSPPPDLIITEITTPSLTFSGQPFNMTFNVKNIGSGATAEAIWKDVISLIPAPSNEDGISSSLQTRTHLGALLPDSSYLVNLTLNMPANIYGDYQIRVHTDALNDVFEFATEGNNTLLSNTIQVILTPPADLVVDSLLTPDIISLYQTYPVTYQVKNDGGSSPTVGWTDRYYLSQSPVYNPDFLIHLGYVYHNAALNPDQYNSKSIDLKLIGDYEGTYYLYVFSDFNNKVDEFEFEGNNITRSDPFIIIRPDLSLSTLQHPVSVLSGTQMSITTPVINQGPGYFKSTFSNRYYLSADNVLSTSTDLLLTTKNLPTTTINPNGTINNTFLLTIPVESIGSFYIIAQTDATQTIFELNELNNTISSPLTVFEPPHADIYASGLVVPDMVTAGISFSIEYELKNQGSVPVSASAVDSIFFSFSPTWLRSTATPLATRTTTQLDTATSVTYSVNINPLIDQNPNEYYIYIISDATAKVYEGSGEANNILRSDQIVLNAYPQVDLMLDNIAGISDTLESGQAVNIQYDVTNMSGIQTYYTTWTDKVYLSTDNVFQKQSDMLIGEVIFQGGSIAAGSTKNIAAGIQIPHGIEGNYYLIVEADGNDLNNDLNLANNANAYRTSGIPKLIHVKLARYPDLQPVDFVVPVSVIAGQYFNIVSKVSNEGLGKAGIRADRIFASTNSIIDHGDLLLSSTSKSMLDTGSFQTDTISVFLPANYSGNYYLILSVDHLNNVYEFIHEQNNKLLATVVAVTPPPAEIYVKNIIVPDSVFAGHTGDITWQTGNQGINPASGIFREIVYMSIDTSWSLNDEVVAIWDGQVTLNPGGLITKTVPVTYNNVTNGDYHTIVRTDARNNFLESNEDNNDGYSYDQTNIDIEEIFLDHLKEDSLYPNAIIYYKLQIDAEQAGRNMLISLTGDSLVGINQMYVKYGAVPTQADHDFAYSEPFSSNQQVLVRDIVPGYYYVMVQGFKSGSNTGQGISVLARLLRMELLELDPPQGGNKGYTTIVATGSDLDSLVEVRLFLDDTTQAYVIIADTFFVQDNGTKVIARFDLTDQPLGHYHFQCLTDHIWMASLRRGFEIIEGTGPEIALNWDFNPKSFNARFNSLFQIKIDVENTGDSDAEGKRILVGTTDFNNPVYYTLGDYYNGLNHMQLILLSEDLNGFPGVLRPGGRRTYYVYGSISGTQGFAIHYDK